MSISSRNSPKKYDYEKFNNELKIISNLESAELKLALLNKLIEDGLDVNANDVIGYTHLHWASYWNSTIVVEFLLKQGANPNSRAHDFVTPIHNAAASREAATANIIRILIKYGANPNAKSKSDDHTGVYPLQKATSSNYGCGEIPRARSYEIARTLKECGADIQPGMDPKFFEQSPAVTEKQNESQLSDADKLLNDGITLSNIDMVKKSLEGRANLMRKTGDFTSTLYSQALSSKNYDLIAILIKAGGSREEALFSGAICADIALIKLTLALGADPNAINNSFETPLHYICHSHASEKKALRAVQVLIEAGANVNSRDSGGNNPMRIAAYWGKMTIVKELIKHGSDYQNRQKFHNYPLARGNENVGKIIDKALKELAVDQDNNLESDCHLQKRKG